MQRLRQLIAASTGVFALLATATLSNAQISFTQQDMLGQIGSTQVFLNDESTNISINVGAAGPNQVWDFRNQAIIDSLFSINEFLRPDQTVSAGTFPTANFVQRITAPEEEESFEIFLFLNVAPDVMIQVGDSSRFSFEGNDSTFVSAENDTVAPLPVTFGTTWITTSSDTTGTLPLFATISNDTTRTEVDAWGTVRLPMGDFNCLRLRQDVTINTRVIVNGIVFSNTTETFIHYNWIAKDAFLIASVISQPDETNPNFTSAQSFGRLDAIDRTPVSAGDEPTLPLGFALQQNYPNPFNPETVIRYELSQSAPVELAIYNVRGERVRVVVNSVQPAGSHQVRWDGTDDRGQRVSSGVYLYRLTSGERTLSKRMLLLR